MSIVGRPWPSLADAFFFPQPDDLMPSFCEPYRTPQKLFSLIWRQDASPPRRHDFLAARLAIRRECRDGFDMLKSN
jgi:hypothetical protein